MNEPDNRPMAADLAARFQQIILDIVDHYAEMSLKAYVQKHGHEPDDAATVEITSGAFERLAGELRANANVLCNVSQRERAAELVRLRLQAIAKRTRK